jgi:ElaB/YqjD/DUF883 family membrane-anchored ribosome-binding protein
MKEETALARPLPPEPTVERVRDAIARTRSELVKSAAALKRDLSPLAGVVELVAKHPYLSLGAALAVGYFLGRRKP